MIKILPVILLIACSSAAHAMPIYSYTTDNLSYDLSKTSPAGGVNANAGDVFSLNTSFDVGNQIFTWDYKARPSAGGAVTDGFWLVVSDGPNPKGDIGEYAILYGDLVKSRVTAYVYSGQNNSKSYKISGIFLKSFENAITTTKVSGVTSVSMTIGTSTINGYTGAAANWDGVSFGNQIGIWFHPSANSIFTYENDDTLKSFSKGTTGWYDTNAALTTTVPEPAVPGELSNLTAIVLAISSPIAQPRQFSASFTAKFLMVFEGFLQSGPRV